MEWWMGVFGLDGLDGFWGGEDGPELTNKCQGGQNTHSHTRQAAKTNEWVPAFVTLPWLLLPLTLVAKLKMWSLLVGCG